MIAQPLRRLHHLLSALTVAAANLKLSIIKRQLNLHYFSEHYVG